MYKPPFMILVLIQLGLWVTTPLLGQDLAHQVPVPWSEMHQFQSESGVRYDIYVGLPPEFDPAYAGGYPVLFVLDAPIFFLTLPMVWLLRGPDSSGVIVVGIDKPFDTRSQWRANRTLDFTPTSISEFEREYSEQQGHEAKTGGADAFVGVLTDEIIPWVQTRFPVAPERGLVGFSLGGLFALHVLFSSPGSFNDYLVLSPSLHWDGGVKFDTEADFAADHQQLAACLSAHGRHRSWTEEALWAEVGEQGPRRFGKPSLIRHQRLVKDHDSLRLAREYRIPK
jgi:predicted alpha/beta superfamily hydrolase